MTTPDDDPTTTIAPLRAGFVGLGVMGRAQARRILAAGIPLTVHSRTAWAVEALVAEGATAAASPAEVAAASDVVIVMVPDAPDLEAVLNGPDGILAGAHDGLVVAGMGTHHPGAMPPLAERCAAVGVRLLDAPVSGGEVGAIEGSLSIMAGGDAVAFERALPVFRAMGRTIVHVGPSGAGQMTKACNQLIVGATIAAVAEGLRLAEAAGVDRAVVRTALTGGYATSRVLEIHGGRMIDRNFVPGGRSALHAKDAHIIQDTAQTLGVELPVFDVVAERFDRLVAAGGGDLDHSALILLLEEGEIRDADRAAHGES
jgi:2-hydroxy-3-oxopropionate reductase